MPNSLPPYIGHASVFGEWAVALARPFVADATISALLQMRLSLDSLDTASALASMFNTRSVEQRRAVRLKH
jgi:hypothetical protein